MTGYKQEWIEWYQYLESLRQSGVTNMYGARPYLQDYMEERGVSCVEAANILFSWMQNYEDLLKDGIINRGDIE